MSPAPTRAVRTRAGFSLLELLVVASLVGILMALWLGTGHRAVESGQVARARSELTALSVALERYRTAYGDYPRTADAATLLQALLGRFDPGGQPLSDRSLLDISTFSVSGGADPFLDPTATLVDPWGRPLVYIYRTPSSGWANTGYVLYSVGPDGRDSAALLPGGYPDTSQPANLDNFYADQP